MTSDRRRIARRRVLRRARIVFRNGNASVDCVVLDMSDGGARLRLGDWLGLPDEFELRLENGPAHRVRVCYRAAEIAGVRFDDVAPTSGAIAAANRA